MEKKFISAVSNKPTNGQLCISEDVVCPFCSIDNVKDDIICEGEHSVAVLDRYPVSKGHSLVIPKRHVSNYFDLTEDEIMDMWLMVNYVKGCLDYMYEPDGYNVGINVGEVAGQTIKHCHIHIIPRYKDDVEEPMGGVRGVIPEKRKYVCTTAK